MINFAPQPKDWKLFKIVASEETIKFGRDLDREDTGIVCQVKEIKIEGVIIRDFAPFEWQCQVPALAIAITHFEILRLLHVALEEIQKNSSNQRVNPFVFAATVKSEDEPNRPSGEMHHVANGSAYIKAGSHTLLLTLDDFNVGEGLAAQPYNDAVMFSLRRGVEELQRALRPYCKQFTDFVVENKADAYQMAFQQAVPKKVRGLVGVNLAHSDGGANHLYEGFRDFD